MTYRLITAPDADKSEHWPIERLIPRADNPRTHSPAQIAAIAASIQEFGLTNPVLVGADENIIAGHARVLAARKLGMTQVPVILLKHLSEAQRRALVIADNQLSICRLRLGCRNASHRTSPVAGRGLRSYSCWLRRCRTRAAA